MNFSSLASALIANYEYYNYVDFLELKESIQDAYNDGRLNGIKSLKKLHEIISNYYI